MKTDYFTDRELLFVGWRPSVPDDERTTSRLNAVTESLHIPRQLNDTQQLSVGRAVLIQASRIQRHEQATRPHRQRPDTERVGHGLGGQPPLVGLVVGRHPPDALGPVDDVQLAVVAADSQVDGPGHSVDVDVGAERT